MDGMNEMTRVDALTAQTTATAWRLSPWRAPRGLVRTGKRRLDRVGPSARRLLSLAGGPARCRSFETRELCEGDALPLLAAPSRGRSSGGPPIIFTRWSYLETEISMSRIAPLVLTIVSPAPPREVGLKMFLGAPAEVVMWNRDLTARLPERVLPLGAFEFSEGILRSI